MLAEAAEIQTTMQLQDPAVPVAVGQEMQMQQPILGVVAEVVAHRVLAAQADLA
jgi:hypothetical protein